MFQPLDERYINCATSDVMLEPLEFALVTYLSKCGDSKNEKVLQRLKDEIIEILQMVSRQRRTTQAWEAFSILCRLQGDAYKTKAEPLFTKWVARLYERCDLGNIKLVTIQAGFRDGQIRTQMKIEAQKSAKAKAKKEIERQQRAKERLYEQNVLWGDEALEDKL